MIDRERLRAEMARQGISQAVLASAVGVSPAAIQQVLNGSTRNPRSTRQMAKILGVSLEWLEGESDDPKPVYKNDIRDDDLEPVAIPYFTRDFNRDDQSSEAVATRVILISRSWVRSILPSGISTDIIMFRFTARDMAPTILPGDDVIVVAADKFDNHVGSIWMFDYQGRSIFRRIRRIDADTLRVFADNPATAEFDVREPELSFVGKVVWQGRSLAA